MNEKKINSFTTYTRSRLMSCKKKKKKTATRLSMILCILMGAACGWFIGSFLGTISDQAEGSDSGLYLVWMVLILVISYYGHILIHEAGHLVFGLLTGYRFASFRVGSFMWMKEGGKLRVKRLSVTGTGGQCLMSPPPMKEGRMPVFLYNYGGVIFNLLVSAICILMSLCFREGELGRPLCLIPAVMGIGMAALNGIPLNLGTINNDGYNALSLRKYPKALEAFRLQMNLAERMAKGDRLREMPAEWFRLPTGEELEDGMVASVGVFYCNYMLDAQEFQKAEEGIRYMLKEDCAIVDLHRKLLICDLAYLELAEGKRSEALSLLEAKEQKSFMKSMKKFPSVIRTLYAAALLGEEDEEKAAGYREYFEKIARTYPYQGDILSERELLETALQIRDRKKEKQEADNE